MFDQHGCQPSCVRNDYEVASGGDALVLPRAPSDHPNATHGFTFYVREPRFTVRTEFAVYRWMSFLADCAGMGGILLGFSLLGTFDWASQLRTRNSCTSA